MSWRAAVWALEQVTGSSGAKLTLLALATYANRDNVAWPSQQTLADDTEQSLDSIQRHVRALENAGLLSIQRQRRGAGQWPRFQYRLHVWAEPHHAAQPEPHHAARPGRKWPVHRAANSRSTGPQALRLYPSRESLSEPSEPQGAKMPREEPSQGRTDHTARARLREEEEKRLAEERKRRETYQELKQRLGNNWGLKSME